MSDLGTDCPKVLCQMPLNPSQMCPWAVWGRGGGEAPPQGAALGPFLGKGAAARGYGLQSASCFPADDFFAEDAWLCAGSRREPS